MRIKIDGFESPAVLRAVSAFVAELASIKEQRARRDDESPAVTLTPGDTEFPFAKQFVVAETTDTTMTIAPAIVPFAESAEVPAGDPNVIGPATEPAKRTRRTRAQIAADKLSATPAAPSAPVAPSVPVGGEQLQLTVPTPEVPAAPLAPAVPAAPSVATPSAPVASATPATPPTPTIPSAATATVPASGSSDAPTTFPTLMRALSPALASQKLTAEALNGYCAQVGVTNLQGLLQAQQHVPAVYALVAASGVLS